MKIVKNIFEVIKVILVVGAIIAGIVGMVMWSTECNNAGGTLVRPIYSPVYECKI